jgi:hypothetical protein
VVTGSRSKYFGTSAGESHSESLPMSHWHSSLRASGSAFRLANASDPDSADSESAQAVLWRSGPDQ